jgi:hypothetical protein
MQYTVVDLSNALEKFYEFFINLVHIFDLWDIDIERLNYRMHWYLAPDLSNALIFVPRFIRCIDLLEAEL